MKYKKSVYQSLAQITQFGLGMIVPICLCTFLGIALDKWLHTGFLVIVFFFLGAAAGFRNIFLFARQIYKKDTHSPYESRVKSREESSPYEIREKSGDGQSQSAAEDWEEEQ